MAGFIEDFTTCRRFAARTHSRPLERAKISWASGHGRRCCGAPRNLPEPFRLQSLTGRRRTIDIEGEERERRGRGRPRPVCNPRGPPVRTGGPSNSPEQPLSKTTLAQRGRGRCFRTCFQPIRRFTTAYGWVPSCSGQGDRTGSVTRRQPAPILRAHAA
jgi:hypothetical protein